MCVYCKYRAKIVQKETLGHLDCKEGRQSWEQQSCELMVHELVDGFQRLL